jgi:beta-xylosidase
MPIPAPVRVVLLTGAVLLAQPGRFGPAAQTAPVAPWVPDQGAGTYRNPVIFADYSDPDVVRAGDDFYLVASSFNATPALPILHSRDLVNWTIVGHAAARLPSPRYDLPQHGLGVWAPSLRLHDGRFWIYFGDPDLGIFMTTAADPRGPWDPLTLVAGASGWIDPCPLWDDDGTVYLVHAWAKSRAGFNSVLTVRRLTADGRRLVDDNATTVFDGTISHPTIEGPKLYKRNGYYYIFAPAGGVTNGWQTVLRSKTPLGPYEDRIVLARGGTAINGPHQGGWVDTVTGDSWFVHFQDRGPYGRVVHLQPLVWRNDWPVIGADPDGDGVGEPIAGGPKPVVRGAVPAAAPQTSDEFDGRRLGLQWQWEANEGSGWQSLSARPGWLRLSAQPIPGAPVNLWNAPHLLMQKLPAESFDATAAMRLDAHGPGDAVSLVVFGLDYALIRLVRGEVGFRVEQATCHNASEAGTESVVATASGAAAMQLRVSIASGDVMFSYSLDGLRFQTLGDRMTLREGKWMGAKFGLVATRPAGSTAGGSADVDWVRAR